MTENKIDKIKLIIFALFIYILILLSVFANNTIDMDYWARLLQGNAFFEFHHILKQDPFSYISTHNWIDHEWGSSVIFSFFQNIFGFKGILFLRSIIVFLLFFFIYKSIKFNTDKTSYLAHILCFSFACFAMPTIIQSGLRCHFFTFLFFTVFIYLLEKVRKENKFKLLIILPLLMLFWCNIHGGCVSGLGLLFIYSIGEFLNKKPYKFYLFTLIACLSVLFINPYGFEYVKFIFMATTMERPFVTEWISPFMHSDLQFLIWFKCFYILSFIFLLINLKKVKADYTKFILLFVCAYLSFKYVKNTPFFIIVSLIFFYEYFYKFCSIFSKDKVKEYLKNDNKLTSLYINIAYGCFFVLFFLIFLKSAAENAGYSFLSQQPVREIEFFKINDMQGKILAPFDMGSYIVYKLYPKNLIYMDGRYEEVYYPETKKYLDDFYNKTQEKYEVLEGENKPDYIIVPANALINDFLIKNEDYKTVYKNEDNIIYSLKEKLKNSYLLPSNDNKYYTSTAFKTNFKYTDDIIINGEKVIFH